MGETSLRMTILPQSHKQRILLHKLKFVNALEIHSDSILAQLSPIVMIGLFYARIVQLCCNLYFTISKYCNLIIFFLYHYIKII